MAFFHKTWKWTKSCVEKNRMGVGLWILKFVGPFKLFIFFCSRSFQAVQNFDIFSANFEYTNESAIFSISWHFIPVPGYFKPFRDVPDRSRLFQSIPGRSIFLYFFPLTTNIQTNELFCPFLGSLYPFREI